MRKANRLLAVLLAGTMVMGTGLTAFAADETGSTTGTGEFEGHVEKSVLSVQLPTVPAENPFSYTMDPEGLIAATEGAKNKDATFEPGASVYFLSAANTYTKDSAKLKVVNKGTADADVTVKASTAANTNVEMVTGTDAFTAKEDIADDNKGAELYLGLVVAEEEAVAVQAEGGTEASVSVGLKGNDKNYEVKYDEATKKYSYAAKADVPDTAWNSFEFGLTGACNTDGDYSTADLAAADVTVTWSYAERATDSSATLLDENATEEPADADPSIEATGTYNKTTGVITATVDLGAGTKETTLASAKYGSSVAKATNDVVNASVTGTTFTGSVTDAVKTGWSNLSGPFYVVITLADGTTENVTLTVTE